MQNSAKVDWELKLAFGELQKRMLDTTRKVKVMDMQIDTLKKTKQKTDITSAEIKSLPENTRVYESIGRLFLYTPTPKIINRLDEKSRLCLEKKKAVETEKTSLEKALKESENNLRELVQHKKDGISSTASSN